LRSQMRKYDAVILPISFAETDRHMSELNIATRMSECLASSTATLVVGPPYAAMVRFLQPTGAACILSDDALADWPRVVNCLKNSAYRRQLLAAARELVLKELSTAVMEAGWRAAMNKLAECSE
jgi:hypothetical protein